MRNARRIQPLHMLIFFHTDIMIASVSEKSSTDAALDATDAHCMSEHEALTELE